jgi:ABC-type phosphate transport system substrate-binding protein
MRQPPRVWLLLALAAALGGAALGSPRLEAASPPLFRLIVNPQNGATAVDRKFVADVFLKKTTRWPDGESAHPVDLTAEAPARAQFSEEVIRRSVSAVKSYWQQLVFSGRDVPPPELDRDDDVIRYVLRFPGGIGYVSGAANVDRVKVVAVR